MKLFISTFLISLMSIVAFAQIDFSISYSEALPSDYTKSVVEINSLNEIWVGTYHGIARYDGENWTQETDLGGASNLNAYEMVEAGDGTVWVALGGGGVSSYNSGIWNNYTVSDGLASNSNWAIAEDSSGNIWVGSTDQGVSVFDGFEWAVYNTDNGMVGNSVVEILTTFRGEVWLGTANGVSIWDGSDYRNMTDNEGLPSNLVRSLYQDFNGNVCVGTSSGLGMYNGAEWTYLTTDEGLQTNNLLDVTQMHNGDFLFATDIGMIHYDGLVSELLDYSNGIAQDIVKSITVDSNGKIWVCTPFRGISVVDTENSFYNVRTNHDLVNDNVNRLYVNNDILWVGTDQGANYFDNEIWRTFNNADGLVTDEVLDITVQGDTMYFACMGGLSVYYDEVYSNLTLSDGLISDTLNSVEVLADGTIYLATYSGLMEILSDGSMNTFTTLEGLPNDTIWTLEEDLSGNLWIGTQNGLSVYDGISFVNYSNIELGGNIVKSLLIDDIGTVWAGTENTLAHFESDVWNVYSHLIPDSPVIDLILYENSIAFLYEGTGNVEYFDLSSSVFAATTYTHKTAIVNFDDTYLFLGSDSGIDVLEIVTEPVNAFSLVNSTCPDASDGSIIFTANVVNPPYEYSIDNGNTWQGETNFTGLISGQYHLKVKNALQQYTIDSTMFLVPQQMVKAVIGIDQIDCNNDANGEIELFIDNPTYVYNWSDAGSGLLRQNLIPDTYAVTVTDGVCTVVRTNEIIQPEALVLDATTTDVLCFGDNSGEIDLEVTGGTMPYSYLWSNGMVSEDNTDLPAGDYNVTVTDAHGCTAELSEALSQPSEALSASGDITNILCFGDSNGSILLDISGGTSGYSFVWNDGIETEDRSGIIAGDYSVTITDAHSCTFTDAYTVIQNPGVEFTFVSYEDVLCFGEANGSIMINTEGGTGDLSYEWELDGQAGVFSTEEDLSDLVAGTYTVVVSDENDCTVDSTISLIEPLALSLSFDETPISCQGYNDAEIAAVPTDGTNPYISYYWSYGDDPTIMGVDSIISNCQSGMYHVTVTDAHYCEIVDSIEIIDPPAHTVELIVSDMTCHGSENGEIEVIVDGGSATGLSYTWSNGAGNVPTVTGLGEGTYFVTIEDATSCQLIDTADVVEPPLGDLGAFDNSGIGWLCSGSNAILDAGAGYVSYLWSTGSSDQSITVFAEDTYSVFVVDDDNCEYGDTIELELSYPYDDEEICFVSVDADNHINLIWNKTPDVGTSEYKIYKENSVSSEFELLETVSYNLPAIYVDTESDASQSDENYKISVVDTCGNESQLSEMHSSISLTVSDDVNGGCHLNWDSYEGYFVVYYFIMRGTSPDNLQLVDSVLYSDFDYAEMNPEAEGVYYQIMVKRPDACAPGDGSDYGYAYSNIEYCDNITGIAQMNYGAINVYPNPFEDRFTVDTYLNMDANITLRLFNSMGQLVYEEKYFDIPSGEHSFFIDESSLIPGLYSLQLHFGNQVWQQQIVKQ